MDIYACKDWIVIWGHNVRRSYDRVEGYIGRSYDEIKVVTMSVSRDFQCWLRYNWQEGKKIWIV